MKKIRKIVFETPPIYIVTPDEKLIKRGKKVVLEPNCDYDDLILNKRKLKRK